MPVIRFDPDVDQKMRERLVLRIAEELTRGGFRESNTEPLIVELPLFNSRRFSSAVVWSKWDSVPWPERSQIIVDAYARAASDHLAILTSATGLTWEEADANALFKYAITPNYRSGDVSEDLISSALTSVGGIRAPDEKKLRFLDHASAEAALKQLQRTLPDGNWSLVPLTRTND